MGEPDLHSDESVILTTQDVFVKSIPFEAILTSNRIILVDRKKNLIPPKDILLATIRDVEPGENAIRDHIITLAVITSSGDTRQVILTFARQAGGSRKRERDEWVKALRELTSSSIRKVIRKVIPAFDQEPGRKYPEPAVPVKAGVTGRPSAKKDIEGVLPKKKIVETSQVPERPVETTSLPYGSFCSRCGTRLPPDSAFCNRCGARNIVPGKGPVSEPQAQTSAKPVPAVEVLPTEQEERPQKREIPSAGLPTGGTVPGAGQKQAAARAKPARRDRGIFPRIFQKKESQQKQAPPSAAPKSPPSGASTAGSRRRVFIAIAVIAGVVIAVACGAFVYMNYLRGTPGGPGETPGGPVATTPAATTATTRPAATSTVTGVYTEPTPVIIPSDGVYVHVSYLGAWRGSYGITGALRSIVDSGEKVLQVENATGTVQASIRKDDSSTRPHELVVEIYRNSALIRRGVTTDPNGMVDISVNLATATPISVTTAASGTPPPTTPAANATTTQTTAPVTTATNSH
jgi:hypothetical protein